MAEVSVEISGRNYRLACRDGEENALLRAAALIDGKARDLSDALGAMGEARLLLMTALLVAGDYIELKRTHAQAPDQQSANGHPAQLATGSGSSDAELQILVERIEALADRLEKAGALT